jgi:hypothetical protein
MLLHVRVAGPEDAGAIAAIHAASWRAFYRGSLSARFLDGDLLAERQQAWSTRLSMPVADQQVFVVDVDDWDPPGGGPLIPRYRVVFA